VTRPVLIAVGLALAVSLCVAPYGLGGTLITAAILVPLGAAMETAAEALARGPGPLRRQLLALGALAATGLAVGVALFVRLMFLSSHDGLLTILLAVYMSLTVGAAAWALGRRVVGQLEAVRATLTAVGEGRRDVRTGIAGAGEIPALAADVDAMVARLDGEERARRTLLAGLSHDLRTPLTALQLLARAIDDDLVDAATRRDYAARIATHVGTLEGMIANLFEAARLERGEVSWKLERVDDLNILLDEAVETMRPAAAAAGVRMSTELNATAPAFVDPEALMRVIFNLVQNALRHTPAGGMVTVRAVDGAQGIDIEVRDSGEGIPPDDLPHVFEPFYRGGSQASRPATGSGLGLAISRAIVEAHGGRIWLGDSAQGTAVRLRLPGGAAA
jgi:signal transduction histidine kinase